MPNDFSVYLTSRLMPGADTFSSRAAPPMVPVTITARITSTWRSVIICELFPCGVTYQILQRTPNHNYSFPVAIVHAYPDALTWRQRNPHARPTLAP